MTVQFGSKDCPLLDVYSKDRPLSPFWIVHFEPDSNLTIILGSKLETGFGWCWSLNLGMGLYSFLLGIIIQMMDCFAQSHIQEFFNFVPWEENDCFDCQQLGFKCDHCTK